jgi:hypothetical protein
MLAGVSIGKLQAPLMATDTIDLFPRELATLAAQTLDNNRSADPRCSPTAGANGRQILSPVLAAVHGSGRNACAARLPPDDSRQQRPC